LLAFVLAATFALLVAIGLTVVEAVRGARDYRRNGARRRVRAAAVSRRYRRPRFRRR